ncbi:MAG: JAB domain-containing protein [Flavobacteriia bacterium]|nr:JAB domain-containing protein [Flavobacteriia bacterium]
MKEFKSKTKLFELKKLQTDFPNVKITQTSEAFKFIRQFYGDDIEVFESVFILLMNRANNTIGYAKISQGGIVGSVVDIKIIAKFALDTLASGIILAHNHPSGNMTPSSADKQITRKVKSALNLIDVELLDHLIIHPSEHRYYSFVNEGEL